MGWTNRADWPLTQLRRCTHGAMNVSFLHGLPALFPPLSCPQSFHTAFLDGCFFFLLLLLFSLHTTVFI